MLTRIAEHTAAGAAELADVMHREHSTGPRAEFGLLAAEYGRRQYEAVYGWALWALTQLPAEEPATP